ncbi:MAG: hypothetical protein H7Y86_10160 [Rhizobacter sp.]|nr:hypothetical protein [Ferruginibacter sp.]
MKKTLFLSFVSFIIFTTNAQVKIGSAGNPNTNAVLELDGGTNKGFLLPRISNPQMILLNTAPDGLMIYNTTDNSIYIRKIGAWRKLTDELDGGNGLVLPYTGSASVAAGNSVFKIQNSGAGNGINGEALGTGAGGFFNSVNGPALITGTGNVGIGTLNTYAPNFLLTPPQFPLDVSGRVRIRNYPGGSPGIWFDKVANTPTLEHSAFLGVVNDSIFGLFGAKNFQWKFFMNHDNNNFGIYNSNPRAPLSFQAVVGNKLDFFYVSPTSMYGLGLGSGELQLYTADNTHHTSIGYGSNAAFTETFRVNNNGNTVTSNPVVMTSGTENASYYKTNNLYTGAIKTIGDGPNRARLSMFTFASSGSGGLLERMTINDEGLVGLGVSNPTRPLSFPAALGKKISLYPGAGGDVGFSVEGNDFRMHSDNANAVISFGYDNFTLGYKESFRTTPWGNTIVTNPVNLATGIEVASYFKTANYFTGAVKTIGTGTNAARLGLFAYSTVNAGSLKEYLSITDDGNIGLKTITPNSTLQVEGSVSMPIKLLTANYTAADADYSLFYDCSSTLINATVTLPAAAGKKGRIYIIAAAIPLGVQGGGISGASRIIINNEFGNNVFEDNPVWQDPRSFQDDCLMHYRYTGEATRRKLSVTLQSDGSIWRIINTNFQY